MIRVDSKIYFTKAESLHKVKLAPLEAECQQ